MQFNAVVLQLGYHFRILVEDAQICLRWAGCIIYTAQVDKEDPLEEWNSSTIRLTPVEEREQEDDNGLDGPRV